MYTDNEKNEFIALRAQGFSYAKISGKLNIPARTLINWNKEKLEEICRLKESAFEELLDSLKVSTAYRFRTFANDLNKIEDELKKYSFKDFDLMELMKLKVKILSELSKLDNPFAMVNKNFENIPPVDDTAKLKSKYPRIDYNAVSKHPNDELWKKFNEEVP